jgi:hypothetical protein
MTTTTITVEATLQVDGQTMRLAKKISLPPGPVTLTVQSREPKTGPTMMEVLDRIHQDQQQRGRKHMTEEEMASEISLMRTEDSEYEERWQNIWTQTGKEPKRTDRT